MMASEGLDTEVDMQKIALLLTTCSSHDPDERYIATSDIVKQLEAATEHLNPSLQVPVRNAMLKLLEDKSADVRSVTITSLPLLAKTLEPARGREILERLATLAVTEQVQGGVDDEDTVSVDVDMIRMGLKSMLTTFATSQDPTQGADHAATVMTVARVVLGAIDERTAKQTLHVQAYVNCLQILRDIYTSKILELCQSECAKLHETLVTLAMPLLEHKSGDVRREATALLGETLLCLTSERLDACMSGLILPQLMTQNQNQGNDSYLKLITEIVCTPRKDTSKFLQTIVPIFLTFCSSNPPAEQEPLEPEEEDHRTELWELCLNALAVVLKTSPQTYKQYSQEILNVALNLLSYDPDYDYASSAVSTATTAATAADGWEEDGDEEDDGWGDEDNDSDFDFEEQADEYPSDNDTEDTSWRARRGAIAVISAYVSCAQASEKQFVQIFKLVLRQVCERDAVVCADVSKCLLDTALSLTSRAEFIMDVDLYAKIETLLSIHLKTRRVDSALLLLQMVDVLVPTLAAQTTTAATTTTTTALVSELILLAKSTEALELKLGLLQTLQGFCEQVTLPTTSVQALLALAVGYSSSTVYIGVTIVALKLCDALLLRYGAVLDGTVVKQGMESLLELLQKSPASQGAVTQALHTLTLFANQTNDPAAIAVKNTKSYILSLITLTATPTPTTATLAAALSAFANVIANSSSSSSTEQADGYLQTVLAYADVKQPAVVVTAMLTCVSACFRNTGSHGSKHQAALVLDRLCPLLTTDTAPTGQGEAKTMLTLTRASSVLKVLAAADLFQLCGDANRLNNVYSLLENPAVSWPDDTVAVLAGIFRAGVANVPSSVLLDRLLECLQHNNNNNNNIATVLVSRVSRAVAGVLLSNSAAPAAISKVQEFAQSIAEFKRNENNNSNEIQKVQLALLVLGQLACLDPMFAANQTHFQSIWSHTPIQTTVALRPTLVRCLSDFTLGIPRSALPLLLERKTLLGLEVLFLFLQQQTSAEPWWLAKVLQYIKASVLDTKEAQTLAGLCLGELVSHAQSTTLAWTQVQLLLNTPKTAVISLCAIRHCALNKTTAPVPALLPVMLGVGGTLEQQPVAMRRQFFSTLLAILQAATADHNSNYSRNTTTTTLSTQAQAVWTAVESGCAVDKKLVKIVDFGAFKRDVDVGILTRSAAFACVVQTCLSPTIFTVFDNMVLDFGQQVMTLICKTLQDKDVDMQLNVFAFLRQIASKPVSAAAIFLEAKRVEALVPAFLALLKVNLRLMKATAENQGRSIEVLKALVYTIHIIRQNTVGITKHAGFCTFYLRLIKTKSLQSIVAEIR